jgi:putative tricarboxylic transport membrane protein
MSDQTALAQRSRDHQQAPDTHLRIGTQAVLTALAVYVAIESLSLGLWSSFGPGPGFFPFALAIALGLLAVAWFVQSLRARPAETVDVDRGHAIVVLLSLVVLAATMNFLGYQLAMFLFLMFQLKWRAGRSWALSLILALAGSVGVYHGFDQGLMVQLPKSVWGL